MVGLTERKSKTEGETTLRANCWREVEQLPGLIFGYGLEQSLTIRILL
jgi:hypothetical protein